MITSDPMPSRRPLLIFAKAPVPGKVKTRLIPALGAEGACSLYQRLLEHCLLIPSRNVGYRFNFNSKVRVYGVV